MLRAREWDGTDPAKVKGLHGKGVIGTSDSHRLTIPMTPFPGWNSLLQEQFPATLLAGVC